MSARLSRYFMTKSMVSVSKDGIKYLSQDEAIKIDEELFQQCAFSVDQLMELAGLSCAQAIHSAYSRGNVLVAVGPGNNGGDGLVCARHLKHFGFEPSVLVPKQPHSDIMQRLLKQIDEMKIPRFQDLSEITDSIVLVVDAVFGFSFKPPIREPYVDILKFMAKQQKPIFSIDVPSGWDVEKGPPEDQTVPALKPHSLISLTAPKLCAKHFYGIHFLGGRFIPNSIKEKYGLVLPEYEGSTQFVRLDKQNVS